jgi:hypothetical protein
VSRAVKNATFDPIAKAGAMHDYFRGNPEGRNPIEFLTEREPIRSEYRDRDERLRVMDEQGLNAPITKYGEAFRDSKYHLWHANAGARRALNSGIQAPWSGHPKYNFHANDIDFQIEADFIGLDHLLSVLNCRAVPDCQTRRILGHLLQRSHNPRTTGPIVASLSFATLGKFLALSLSYSLNGSG